MANLKERLRAVLGLDTKDFEQGLNKSTQQVQTFGDRASKSLGSVMSKASGLGTAFLGGVAGGVVGAALSGVTGNLTEMVRSIAAVGVEANRAGLSAQVFQEWKYVAANSRIGVDQMVDGFKELSMRADEFVTTGGGGAADAFQRLGYSAADLSRKLKNPSELMLEIIDRMRQIDKAGRLRVADEIFGGALAEQFGGLIDQGSASVRGLIHEAHTAGAVMDEALIRRAEAIDERFSAMTQRVSTWGKALALVLVDLPFNAIETRLNEIFPDEAFGRGILGNEIYDELARLKQLTDEQVTATETLAASHRALGDDARAASNAILSDLNQVPSVLAEQRAGLSEIAEGMRDAAGQFEAGQISAREFADRMDDAQGAASRLFGELEADHGITLSTAISAVGRLATKITEAIALARSLKASLPGGVAKEEPGYLDSAEGPGWEDDASVPEIRPRRAPNDFFWEPITGTGKGGGGVKSEASGKDQWSRTLDQVKAQTDALQAEAASLAAAAISGQGYGDALEYARKRADLLFAAQQAGKQITPELTAEIDQLAAAYVTAAVNADQAADKLLEIEDQGRRGADALTDIFMSVTSGSMSAKEAVADLLMEMARVQARKGFLGLTNSGAGGGVLGFIGGLLGGARAKGGPVQAGVPYLVNEDTPNSEIFVPSKSGAVLNISQAQAALRDQSKQSSEDPPPRADAGVPLARSAVADVWAGEARAKGGPVRAGVPYLVNEDTPNSEIFVPSESGAVLNVSQAQAALAGAAVGARHSRAAVSPEAAGGQARLEVVLSPDLEARVLQQSQQQTVQIVQANNRTLPDQMRRVQNNPRMR